MFKLMVKYCLILVMQVKTFVCESDKHHVSVRQNAATHAGLNHTAPQRDQQSCCQASRCFLWTEAHSEDRWGAGMCFH